MRTKRLQSLPLFFKLPETKASIGFLPLFLSFIISIASTFAWKSTDIDFSSKIGTKYLPIAYAVIASLFVISGFILAALRKTRSPERLFIRLQQIVWSLFLLLWLFEIQYNFSSTVSGIFILKVLGHIYSSITLLSFSIMYDPYDPSSRISKNCYTSLQIAKYSGIAFCGIIFNTIPLQGAHHFIPLIGSLSFIVWLIANFCHPIALYEAIHKKPSVSPKKPSSEFQSSFQIEKKQKKKRISRSTLFLILGSILLNALASSSEYSVIMDFETKFFSIDSKNSSEVMGQFITLFGIGNLLALISSTVWYSVRLSSFGLMAVGLGVLILIQLGETLFLSFPFLHKFFALKMDSSIVSAICTLFLVESLYPVVVQSNMMNVLAALSSATQKRARIIIEAVSEAIGLAVSVMIIEATSNSILPTVLMCISLCALSGFLLFQERQPSPYSDQKNCEETCEELNQEIDLRFSKFSFRQKTPFSFDSLFFDALLDEPFFRFYEFSQIHPEEGESTNDIIAI